MHRSEARILTPHVGSLPRPPALTDLLLRREHEETTDEAALPDRDRRRALDSNFGVWWDPTDERRRDS
jgi:hypothetical protein